MTNSADPDELASSILLITNNSKDPSFTGNYILYLFNLVSPKFTMYVAIEVSSGQSG